MKTRGGEAILLGGGYVTIYWLPSMEDSRGVIGKHIVNTIRLGRIASGRRLFIGGFWIHSPSYTVFRHVARGHNGEIRNFDYLEQADDKVGLSFWLNTGAWNFRAYEEVAQWCKRSDCQFVSSEYTIDRSSWTDHSRDHGVCVSRECATFSWISCKVSLSAVHTIER